jgi:hypothetical protein
MPKVMSRTGEGAVKRMALERRLMKTWADRRSGKARREVSHPRVEVVSLWSTIHTEAHAVGKDDGSVSERLESRTELEFEMDPF